MSLKRNKKSVFELSETELNSRFSSVLEKAVELRKAKNLPEVYRNELCVRNNEFIHEYNDGRKYLIRQDVHNSSEKTIKALL